MSQSQPHSPQPQQRASRRARNVAARRASGTSGAASPTLRRAHATHEAVSAVEVEPPHPPRRETPYYRASHQRLIVKEDRPCFVCGVRRSDLLSHARKSDPRINPYHATAMESHHFPIERSLMDAVDPALLAAVYPTLAQFKTLEEWVDSEYNLLVLCSACHRLADHAIHRALWQDVIATKFARRDAATGARFAFAATPADAAQVEAADEALVVASEPPVSAPPAASAASAAPTSDAARAEASAQQQTASLISTPSPALP